MASVAALAPGLRAAAWKRSPRISTSIMSRLGGTRRHFSVLPNLRPTTALPTSTSTTASVFRSPHSPLVLSRAPCDPSAMARLAGGGLDATADLVPKSAITSHPALGSLQIRCGPHNTMLRTSRLKRKRTFGFLARIRTKKGRKLIARRRAKGRLRLAA